MITADCNIIEGPIDTLDISFACLAVANFHYSSLEKLIEGSFPLLISSKSADPVVDTYYGQYGEFVTGSHLTSNSNHFKENALDANKNTDGRAIDNKAVDKKVAHDGNDQEEYNNQKSKRDYKDE